MSWFGRRSHSNASGGKTSTPGSFTLTLTYEKVVFTSLRNGDTCSVSRYPTYLHTARECCSWTKLRDCDRCHSKVGDWSTLSSRLLWAEADESARYMCNRTPSSVLDHNTLLELWDDAPLWFLNIFTNGDVSQTNISRHDIEREGSLLERRSCTS